MLKSWKTQKSSKFGENWATKKGYSPKKQSCFSGNKTLDQHLGANSKNRFYCSIFSKFVTFLHFFSFLAQKMLIITISTSVWSVQHPNAQSKFPLFPPLSSLHLWTYGIKQDFMNHNINALSLSLLRFILYFYLIWMCNFKIIPHIIHEVSCYFLCSD